MLTGASGYLGPAVLAELRRREIDVIVLGRAPGWMSGVRQLPWRLGDAIPDEAATGDSMRPTAMIHLAHRWQPPTGQEIDPNIEGTRRLRDHCGALSISRFIFASSLSASPHALNHYGRTKLAIEAILAADEESCAARIGLVYGGARRGQWGRLVALARSSPALPLVGGDRLVQPIGLDEVATLLVDLAVDTVKPPRLMVAAGSPVSFRALVQHVAVVEAARRLPSLRLPRLLVPLARIAVHLGLAPRKQLESLLGYVGLTVHRHEREHAFSDPFARLTSERRRGRLQEARCLLTAVLGRAPSTTSLKLYARAHPYLPDDILALPLICRLWPRTASMLEPLCRRNGATEQRLEIAVKIAEACEGDAFFDRRGTSSVRVLLGLALLGLSEAVLLLPRWIFSRAR